MKIVITISLVILFISRLSATTYYLSDNGNDSRDGKSKAKAWCSLQKLSNSMHLLKPGDSILFECGSKFEGKLDISCSGIYLGSYGSGSKPLISGSTEIYHWKSFKKNIWQASCVDCPATLENLFLDGKYLSLGRYPNQGYRTASGSIENENSISDSALHFMDGYWRGAEIVTKSSRWTLDRLAIEEYSHQTFNFPLPASYTLMNGFGYFIQNHFSTLDHTGEWFFNTTTKEIFLYLDPGTDPNDHLIEASTTDVGLNSVSTHDNTLENLAFAYFKIGVTFKNSSTITLLNVDIFHSSKNGLEVTGCKNTLVKSCTIVESGNNGVEWHNNTEGSFIHNTIRRTGLHPGRGVSGNGTHIALYITADIPAKGSNSFENNTVDSTGYTGIDFRTGNTCLKNNIITNFCMIKDDGAGIYTWNNTYGGNSIEGNSISDGIGSGQGTTHPAQLFASGIYIDDRSSDVLIVGNTISRCPLSGIFLHNASDITMVDNRAFANGTHLGNKERGQLLVKLDAHGQWTEKKSLGLKVLQNTWAAESEVAYCVFLSVDKKQDLAQLGTFAGNIFSAINPDRSVAVSYAQSGLCSPLIESTLEDWQQNMVYEKGSTFEKVLKESFRALSKNLIQNGTMTANTFGWMIWPSTSTLLLDKKKIIDGPSLRINIPAGTEGLLYHAGFTLREGKSYRLTFSAMGNAQAKLEFVPLMAKSPWQALGDYTCFTVDSTYKTFTYFFTASQSSTARVNFKSNTVFWIDNVSLQEVTERGSDRLVRLGSR